MLRRCQGGGGIGGWRRWRINDKAVRLRAMEGRACCALLLLLCLHQRQAGRALVGVHRRVGVLHFTRLLLLGMGLVMRAGMATC